MPKSRTKMNLHTKKYIDTLFNNAIYGVALIQLTAEDIQNYKLSLIKNKHNTPKEGGNTLKEDSYTYKDIITSKDDKTSKAIKMTIDAKTYKDNASNNASIVDEPANKKQKLETNEIDVLKFVSSREDETLKFKAQNKSSIQTIKEIASISTEKQRMEESIEPEKSSAKNLKLVLSKENETLKFKTQIKSSLKSVKEIASTSTEEQRIEESIESEKSSAKNVKSMIRVIDPIKMMDEVHYKMWMKNNPFDLKPKHLTNGMKKLSVAKLSTTGSKRSLHSNKLNGVKHTLNGENDIRRNLIEIEKLYIKYFSKSVQDTIVNIANILNIISISNKYHENRINESCKKSSEAEKLKESCDADRLHGKHKTILETKLKNNFIGVISSFAESEFDSVFQMFFLSILSVLRVLDQLKFRKGGIFKNLVHLLCNSLKNSEFDHQFKQNIFSMLRSKTFRPDCINLISVIEDSRDIDPEVTDRMPLFFVSTVNSREYFQHAIDAVTNDSNKDLELLIDNAILQCCINSKFKDPVNLSTVLHPNDKILVPETIQRPINSDVTIQNWFLPNNPDGIYEQIPVLNGNSAVEPSIIRSQPLNNFYGPLSFSLQKKMSESSTSKVIPTKECIVVTPTISNSSLMQVTSSSTATTTTFVPFNPSIQKKKSVANSQLHRAIGIIGIGNKQYQLVEQPLGQLRAVVNDTNILVKSTSTVIIKCYAKHCSNSVTIMCSGCTTVKYCSYDCQQRDSYDNHKDVCTIFETGP